MLGGTQPAPLLVLARFGANKQLTKNKSHRVTPFWHNDTRSRVTVTFGARRPGVPWPITTACPRRCGPPTPRATGRPGAARLALAAARQEDFKAAMRVAEEAAATLEQMRKQGDQSEGTIYALGLALGSSGLV